MRFSDSARLSLGRCACRRPWWDGQTLRIDDLFFRRRFKNWLFKRCPRNKIRTYYSKVIVSASTMLFQRPFYIVGSCAGAPGTVSGDVKKKNRWAHTRTSRPPDANLITCYVRAVAIIRASNREVYIALTV